MTKKNKKSELRFSALLRDDILASFLVWKSEKEAERGLKISYQQALNEIIPETSHRLDGMRRKQN